MTSDPFLQLKRAAARARRAAEKAWPEGSTVVWTHSALRSVTLTGVVVGYHFAAGTGALELRVKVTAEERASKSKRLYTFVGYTHAVSPAKLQQTPA